MRERARAAVGLGALVLAWLTDLFLVFSKDVLIERRSGEALTTAVFFAVLVVVLSSSALSVVVNPAAAAPAVIWLSVAFSSVLAVGRLWQREREESALRGLLVSPLSRSAIFAGKTLGLSLLLVLLQALVIPLTALLFAIDLRTLGLPLAVVSLVATPGVAASATLFGAMTVRTRARELILAIVLFPLQAPALLTAVAATRELVSGALLVDVKDHLWLLVAFDLLFTLGGLSFFDSLMEG